jgi:hypothetical protein
LSTTIKVLLLIPLALRVALLSSASAKQSTDPITGLLCQLSNHMHSSFLVSAFAIRRISILKRSVLKQMVQLCPSERHCSIKGIITSSLVRWSKLMSPAHRLLPYYFLKNGMTMFIPH